MLEENRAPTIEAIRAHGADFGIAWDGDFDRCFFFDEHGDFIEGYYIVGLLASVLLRGEPGGKVVHDPRLTWNTHRDRRSRAAARRCCRSPAMPSSSSACARSTACTAGR